MNAAKPNRPFTLYLLSVCLLIVALGAIPAGIMLILDPSGASMGWTTAMLSASPFSDFLIPGLFLFGVNGVCSVFVLYALWLRPRSSFLSRITAWTGEQWQWAGAFALGVFLIAWIVLQVMWIQTFSPLQVMIAGLGISIVLLDLLPPTRHYYHA